MGDANVSTRTCSRCDEICHGCDNDDDPHLCRGCKKKIMEPKKSEIGLSIKHYVTDSLSVRTNLHKLGIVEHSTVVLENPVSVWELTAEDGNGVWKETYTTQAEKDAFVRGYRAASWRHGIPEPKIHEEC